MTLIGALSLLKENLEVYDSERNFTINNIKKIFVLLFYLMQGLIGVLFIFITLPLFLNDNLSDKGLDFFLDIGKYVQIIIGFLMLIVWISNFPQYPKILLLIPNSYIIVGNIFYFLTILIAFIQADILSSFFSLWFIIWVSILFIYRNETQKHHKDLISI